MHLRRLLLAVFAASVLIPAAGARGQGADPTLVDGNILVLDTGRSFWRFRTVWETEDIAMDDGSIKHVRFSHKDKNWWRKNPDKIVMSEDDYTVEEVPMVRLPASTGNDWMQPDFDDSAWIRSRGPVFGGSSDKNWKLILARGRFEITDPRATLLRLNLTFRGGAVVYLNGKEILRKEMPEGEITTETPALPYDPKIYVDSKGYLAWPHNNKKEWDELEKQQYRHVEEFRIPKEHFVKGANVLAVAIHRAPGNKAQFIRRIERYPHPDERAYWSRCSLDKIQLLAAAGSRVTPNTERVPGRGFQAWNQTILRRVFPFDFPDPFATLKPVQLNGVRNGTFAGQVIVGHDDELRNLKAEAGALAHVGGKGIIPSSAVTVRWARPDGPTPKGYDRGAFDSLDDEPMEVVPVYKRLGERDVGYGATGGSVQPLWISVKVPANAAAGVYGGKVTVSADGVDPIVVPLLLHVSAWTLPVRDKLSTRMDIVQSPESVAMAYGVEMWSDAHWKLLDRTFATMAPLAPKTLYITVIRRTHFGNEDAMVRFVRNGEGELVPDFEIAEKYLDLAVKHWGKDLGVICYVWEPAQSMGHASGTGSVGRTNDRPILITTKSARTGKLRQTKGPAWDTPEAKAFWKNFRDGMNAVLAKRGMEGRMIFGLLGDNRATQQAMDDITGGDKENSQWGVHSHHFASEWQGYKVGFCSALWGIGCRPVDPETHRSYGWRNPLWLVYYPRELSHSSPLVDYRNKLERWMYAVSVLYAYNRINPIQDGTHGLGRLGADFWRVLRDSRGRPRASLAGRYPETYWGQLNMNYCVPYLLGWGKNGAVPTVRSEMFRENVQEVQARIFLEKAVLAHDEQAELEASAPKLEAEIAEWDTKIAAEKSSSRKEQYQKERDASAKKLAENKARLAELAEAKIIDADLRGRCRETLDRRIRMCLHAEGEGLSWFISSGWNERNKALFELAAEVAKATGRD